MMRRAEWPLDYRAFAHKLAGGAINFGGFNDFIFRHIGQYGYKRFGEHGFPGSGRSGKQYIVVAGSGDFQSSFDVLLAFYVPEIVFIIFRIFSGSRVYFWHWRNLSFSQIFNTLY